MIYFLVKLSEIDDIQWFKWNEILIHMMKKKQEKRLQPVDLLQVELRGELGLKNVEIIILL